MRSILIRLICGFAVLFLLTLVVGLFLPNTYAVRRSVQVQADAPRLYALVGDLKAWEQWGPWKENDASLETTLGEKTSGVGASQSWIGRDGDGRLVFTRVDPQSGVRFDLFFNEDHITMPCSLTYQPSGNGHEVTWEMRGAIPVPVLGGYFALTMDGMIGPMFERGLQKLKSAAEASPSL